MTGSSGDVWLLLARDLGQPDETKELIAAFKPAAEELAVRAAKAVGLVVAGIDLLFRDDGSFVLCEVNNNVAWARDMPEVPVAIARCVAKRAGASRGDSVAELVPPEAVGHC